MKIQRGTVFIAIGFCSCFCLAGRRRPEPLRLQGVVGAVVRTDGGYVIEIKSVDAAGRVQAAYFNPNPITVSRAAATRSGQATTVFIELRAPGYPGSTYTLIHDPARDELKGIYHQAALQQNFEVVFVRSKQGP